MSRLYPIRARRGWMGRRKKYGYEVNTDGGMRVRQTKYEPPVNELARETRIEAEHAGYVLRNGVYVWGGRGAPRRKA
jgi:hypothetical protein